ncbi:hypothetical protein NEOLEDRAFT_1175261 [Neolentinus lepideus HHB14362 ss-1]|uniref:Uncharacterized protein n=1 Tax=Neolentinus lepideus HHB14362 ss-1 TaxID=1314782 RepID=A0A165UZ58_9AGAM|nr:hypothetical protein NEOLEDRAFT_1175261 [Neolentinus lepideus HHB14362 ss-1]
MNEFRGKDEAGEVSPAAPSRFSDSPDLLKLPTPSPAPPDEFHPPDNDVKEDELNIRPGYVKDEGNLASAMLAGMDYVFAGQTIEYWSWEDALDYAFKSVVQTVFKGDEHTSKPHTFHEVMQHPEEEHQQWLKAAQDEIQSLVENGMCELIECPPGHKAIAPVAVGTMHYMGIVTTDTIASSEQHNAG